MKTKLHIVISVATQLLFGCLRTAAQTPVAVGDTLNGNDVSALMYSDGSGFWDNKTILPKYIVPKTGNASSIYAAAIWIGGLDAGSQLHMAAETYKQSGLDFWPGPVMDSNQYSYHQDSLWNHVWRVSKSTIDSFRTGKCVGIPSSIKNWPGDGNVAMGEMPRLAPYVDSNHNGYYDPAGGDYPLIRGDQAMYMIYNDDRGTKHGETGAPKMHIEIHLMAYQFNTPNDTPVYQTTFLHYDIYNRSKNTYDSTYLGYWCDMDLGNGGDDYIGCDSADNYWYTYNGTSTDPDGSGFFAGEIGYSGPLPQPAQGVAYLCDTMTHFQYYNNDFTLMGNPSSDTAYYNYLKSIWIDGSHVTYGGNGYLSSATYTNYMLSGNPATGTGWSEVSASNTPGDRRGLSSTGPFTFKAGSEKTLDIALVFARANSGNQNTSVTVLCQAIKDVRNFYSAQPFGCDQSLLGISEVGSTATVNNSVLLFPNPNSGAFTLQVKSDKGIVNSTIKIYNMLGEKVYSKPLSTVNRSLSINLGSQPSGVYLYRVTNTQGNILGQGKFIIQK